MVPIHKKRRFTITTLLFSNYEMLFLPNDIQTFEVLDRVLKSLCLHILVEKLQIFQRESFSSFS